ncbi:MAG: choice-of-anchor D domain-containing protein, partial [Candidatus Cloacimonetes bacterium]|nr:choice-of-anchor D domain-containing protein [Candidatus Cloacimonadota bacterium]
VTSLENVIIYPAQELMSESNRQTSEFIIDHSFYQSGGSYPENLIDIGEPVIMRDLRVCLLTVNPFRFDPQTNKLEIISNLSLSLTVSGNGQRNVKTSDKKRSRFFEPLYQSMVINYDGNPLRDDYQQPSCLFIYANNSQVLPSLQELIDWRHQKGFQVVAVSTAVTGTTNSAIKNYIQNAYNSWENPPEFIILVGDASGSFTIPTWFESWSGYSGEGDHPYTQLEGNDILADAYIGRISINTEAQLQTIINKILKYEKEPYLGNINWFRNALLVGDPNTSGQSCVTTKISIREMMETEVPHFSFDEAYSGNFVQQITNSLNAGAAYMNYRGYLNMSGWGNSNTNNLNNGYMLPYVVTLTCGTGDFYNDDARSEVFLRAGNPSTPKGGIASVGTATWGTRTVLNNCVDAGIYFGLFVDKLYNPGASLVRGKMNLYLNFPNNSNYVNIFSHWNNLMGDPATALWTDLPRNLQVIYNEDISPGQNFLEVTVTDEYGLPVENSWVTIIMGDDDIFSTDFTDTEGKVLLPLSTQQTGVLGITVTKHNFIPYLGEATIAQQDVFINIRQYSVDDDDQGSSNGNGDGIPNPGESIELIVGMQNFGTTNCSDVSATLSSSSAWIEITDDQEEFGNIPPGEVVLTIDDFDFTLAADIPGGTVIPLNFEIEDGAGNIWYDNIPLIVSGANFAFENYNVYDGNNGILDPDEIVDFTVSITNIGTLAGEDIYGLLSCSHQMITVEDSVGYYGDILPGVTQANAADVFVIKASAQALPGQQIPFLLTIYNSQGYEQEITFLLDLGQVSITDPLGPDAYGYYCFDDGDEGYELAPQYNWIEIDPDYGGSGTVINLYDNGNNGDIETIDVPFTFRFYGIPYDVITVCSNGWMSPGATDNYEFMNWHIPGPLGPSPMIAPFWDDLSIGSGNVCYYYDPGLHYFIVEWSRLGNNFNTSYKETFQVIIYDPEFYPTPSGDADLLFQYQEVNNVDQNITEGPYSTVGIEDHSSTVGLEYSFRNLYPTAAKTLQDGMALLFTTRGSSVMAPAEISLDHNYFDIAIQPFAQDSRILEISNNGEQNLFYSISKSYQGEQVDYPEVDRDSGGPDAYGYQWMDSNEPGGPEYNWRNIEGLGQQLSFSTNDQGTELIPLEFPFNFYGIDYANFRVNPNGWIGFGDDTNEWLNTVIPSADAPRPAIMPYWDDLYPYDGENGGGDVYYYSTADSLIVWFDNVIHYPGAHNGTYDFQTILYPDGEILFQYRSVSGDTDTVTIGIQDDEGNIGLQVVFNSDYVENELAVRIKKIIEWIDVYPSSGIIGSGLTVPVNITVTSAELGLGEYLCNLMISSNDPDNNLLILPVNLIVAGELPDITVTPDPLSFGEVEVNSQLTDTLIVTNDGVSPLTITDIEVDLPEFEIDLISFELQPGNSQNILVTFSPLSEEEYHGIMTIWSNDPDESEYQLNISGTGIPITGGNDNNIIPVTGLKQNYPNPFNPSGGGRSPETRISFSLSDPGEVELIIFNLKGEQVKRLVKGEYPLGEHNAVWNGTDDLSRAVSSGIYFYQLKTGSKTFIRKMLLIK